MTNSHLVPDDRRNSSDSMSTVGPATAVHSALFSNGPSAACTPLATAPPSCISMMKQMNADPDAKTGSSAAGKTRLSDQPGNPHGLRTWTIPNPSSSKMDASTWGHEMTNFLDSLRRTYQLPGLQYTLEGIKGKGSKDVYDIGPMHPGDKGALMDNPDWRVYQCLSRNVVGDKGQDESVDAWMSRLKPLAEGKGDEQFVVVGLKAIEDVSDLYPDAKA